jgi:hypothetical protein
MKFLISDTDSMFKPTPIAAGPFKNVHGGALAAVMSSVAIKQAPPHFIPVSQRTDFLRSTPLTSFVTELSIAREGKTCCVYDVEVISVDSSKTTARSTVTFYAPSAVVQIDERKSDPWHGLNSPETLHTLPDAPSPGGTPWMISATDIRSEMNGVYWFKWRGPLLASGWDHWFSKLLAPADWISGFISPDFPAMTVGPWPNTDLSLQVDRALVGEWIGLKPCGHYRREGHGFSFAELIDKRGILGQATATVIAPSR